MLKRKKKDVFICMMHVGLFWFLPLCHLRSPFFRKKLRFGVHNWEGGLYTLKSSEASLALIGKCCKGRRRIFVHESYWPLWFLPYSHLRIPYFFYILPLKRLQYIHKVTSNTIPRGTTNMSTSWPLQKLRIINFKKK